jgi:hypothetical protein
MLSISSSTIHSLFVLQGLTSLNLPSNQIGVHGGECLANALQQNKVASLASYPILDS